LLRLSRVAKRSRNSGGTMSPVERANYLAAIVIAIGIREIIPAVVKGKIDLEVACQIASLPVSEQMQELDRQIRPREELTLLEKFKALWESASLEERSQASPCIAEFVGSPSERTPRVSGVLFPEAVTEKPKAGRMVPTESEFESFYAAYPRRVNKSKSKIAFAKAFSLLRKTMDADQVISVIMAGVAVYAKHANPEALCHPTTWLNGCRWQDEAGSIGSGEINPRKRSSAQLGVFREEDAALLEDAVF